MQRQASARLENTSARSVVKQVSWRDAVSPIDDLPLDEIMGEKKLTSSLFIGNGYVDEKTSYSSSGTSTSSNSKKQILWATKYSRQSSARDSGMGDEHDKIFDGREVILMLDEPDDERNNNKSKLPWYRRFLFRRGSSRRSNRSKWKVEDRIC